MKPRAFFVSLYEIKQNFVFGDQFVDSYTRTVTLSDGSTRTITLTPMVHEKFGEVVKLEDGDHVSYMGVHGATTNGKLMVGLHSLELLYRDERSCAVAILETESVQHLYKTLGTDPELVKSRLSALPSSDPNSGVAHIFAAESVARREGSPLADSVPLDIRLLVDLIIHGTAEIKAALTPSAGQPGDIPFFVVHQRSETDLRSLWPQGPDQTGHALLLNDPLTSHRAAADALHDSLGMDLDTAAAKTREVDESGSCVLQLAAGAEVVETCSRVNAEWRAKGLPLYCLPQRLTSTVPVVM